MRIASADNAARIRRRRRGAAAVELAIVLPVLVLIMVGCVDFGRFLYYGIVVTNAAEEGATYGSLNPPANFGVSGSGTSAAWEAKVQDVAIKEAPGLRMNGADAPINTVTVDPGYTTSGVVQVTVSYTFQTILQYPWLPPSFPVSRTVAMPFTR
jgi:Flp pilus assembly protein TadG